jgi:hypothetical protein
MGHLPCDKYNDTPSRLARISILPDFNTDIAFLGQTTAFAEIWQCTRARIDGLNGVNGSASGSD